MRTSSRVHVVLDYTCLTHLDCSSALCLVAGHPSCVYTAWWGMTVVMVTNYHVALAWLYKHTVCSPGGGMQRYREAVIEQANYARSVQCNSESYQYMPHVIRHLPCFIICCIHGTLACSSSLLYADKNGLCLIYISS